MSADFLNFARQHGLIIERLNCDGQIHRVSTEDKPRGNNGSYMWDGDGFGWVQNWATSDSPVHFKSTKTRSPEELQRSIQVRKRLIDRQRDEVRNKQKAAKIKAQSILAKSPIGHSEYLHNKGLKGFSSHIMYECHNTEDVQVTLVPMYYRDEIVGVQRIYPKYFNPSKKFLFGQRTKGCYHKIGNGSRVYVVEGYATGLSLSQCLNKIDRNYSIYVAFSANNMLNIVKHVDNRIFVCDNDSSETGERVGKQSGCRYFIPPDIDSDFNDFYRDNEFKALMTFKRFLMEK